MSSTSTAVQDSSAQSPQPIVESPEIVAAREKSAAAGYERNRAEATYNRAKKDHGADSPEAKAAKKTLDEAQAKVDKAQAELRSALKLQSQSAKGGKASKEKPHVTDGPPPISGEAPKAPAPKSPAPKADAPKTPDKSPPEEVKVPLERPNGAYLERHQLRVYRSEEFIRINPLLKNRGELRKHLEKRLKELQVDPKTLEKLLDKNRSGEMLLKSGATLLESSSLLEKRSAPKLQKR